MKIKNFLPGLIFLLLAIVMVALNGLEEKPNFYPSMVGKEVPVFKTESLDGKSEVTDKDFKQGKIINFWASWCIACQAEHDILLALQKQGYEIIGVDSGDTREKGLEYLKEHGNPFAMNAYDPKRTLAIAMGVTGMPETFIVGKDGLIYYHYRGALNKTEVQKRLIPILKELNGK